MAWILAGSEVATPQPSLAEDWIFADSRLSSTEPSLAVDWVPADSALASIEPGLVGGWILAASKTAAVLPPGIVWPANLFGLVTDEEDKPIYLAEIIVRNEAFIATTWSDTDGTFDLFGLPTGTLTLICEKEGYKIYESVITLLTGDNEVGIVLEEKVPEEEKPFPWKEVAIGLGVFSAILLIPKKKK